MKNILAIVGSQKGVNSNSHNILKYIMNTLGTNEYNFTFYNVKDILNSSLKEKALINDFYSYDNVILCAPLVMKQLPAPVIELFERLVKISKRKNNTFFSSIIYCNHTETVETKEALEITKNFTNTMNVKWQWGAGLTLEDDFWTKDDVKSKKMYQPITRELEFICASIYTNKRCDEFNFVKPYTPKLIFENMYKMHWYKEAMKNGCLFKIDCKPYAKKDFSL